MVPSSANWRTDQTKIPIGNFSLEDALSSVENQTFIVETAVEIEGKVRRERQQGQKKQKDLQKGGFSLHFWGALMDRSLIADGRFSAKENLELKFSVGFQDLIHLRNFLPFLELNHLVIRKI